MRSTAFATPLRAFALATMTLTLIFAGCKSAPPPPDDNALNSALQAKLTSDKAIGSEPIQTFVQGGVATLQGTVSSEAAKALAASDATQVAGIQSVVNQLAVENAQTAPPPVAPSLPAPSQPIPAQRTKPSATLSRPLPNNARNNNNQANTPYNPPPAPIERHRAEDNANASIPAQPIQPAPQPRQAPPPPPAFRNVTVPAGTTLPVRITQTLDSATTQPGDAFSGSIASDIMVDGLVAIPAGTTINGRVDEVHEAAHFKGSALLTLSVASINRHGERTPVTTDPYTQTGNGRGKNTAEKVGGGAAVGAILGGIFGGGKGAAIGAAAGGGVGAGAQAVTRGQQVQIPSETLIRFRLANPVDVRASTAAGAEGDTNLQRHPNN